MCLCWGVRLENGTSQFFCSQRVSLWMLSLWDTLQDEWVTSPLCASGTLQISVSMIYVRMLFVCLLPKSSPMSSNPSQSQTHWPLKLHTLRAPWLQELMKLAPLTFWANCYGDLFFLFTLSARSVSHPFPQPQLPLCPSSHDLFLSQTTTPHFLTSPMCPLLYL